MWYDIFALFYDRALEKLYRPTRTTAVEALGAEPGSLVLDVACGTGQNFPFLQKAIGPGEIVGVDRSGGMLRRARQRIDRHGWTNIHLVQADMLEFDEERLEALTGRRTVDYAICTLGMTVIEDWEGAFHRTFDLLRSGGRLVLFDAYIEKPIFQTWSSGLVARADLSRRFWEPLAAAAEDFHREQLPGSPQRFGGWLYLASGTKP